MSNNSPSFGPVKLSDNIGDSWLQRVGGMAKVSNDAGATTYDMIGREAVMLKAQGLIAQTYPRQTNLAALNMQSGTANFCGIGLLSGDPITNVSMVVGTAGVGVTLSKVAIYNRLGVLLASSADQGTSWQTAGAKTIALTTPYQVTVDGLYYVAFLAVFSSALAIARGAFFPVGIDSAIGSGAAPFGVQTGLADLPANATIVNGATGGAGTSAMLWAGLS